MLTPIQSAKIVIRCIKAISSSEGVSVEKKLNQVGIGNVIRVKLLIDMIVHGDIGVISRDHKLSSGDLSSISPSSTVLGVSQLVEASAEPIGED
jgi:hypothetical protein